MIFFLRYFALLHTFSRTMAGSYFTLPQTVLISDSLSVFKSKLKTFYSLRLSLTLIRPAASASEVTAVWRYRNSIIIIIIIIIINSLVTKVPDEFALLL